MLYDFTPAADRALATAASWTSREDSDELEAPALLIGLLAEPECRAAIILARYGVDVEAVRRQWPKLRARSFPGGTRADALNRLSAEVEASLRAAYERFAAFPPPLVLATEHLLLGLAAAEHEVSAWLRGQGLDADVLTGEIHELYGHQTGPIYLCEGAEPQSPLSLRERAGVRADAESADSRPHPNPLPEGEGTAVLRIIDAAANRASEGLRVAEDYVRFALDDRHLTGQCKRLRHDLAAALGPVSQGHRLAARETQADVGTALTTASEQCREGIAELLTANFLRMQEALRSLEEFGKLHDLEMATRLKELRYRSYTLQRAVEITRSSRERLARARLYVLIDGQPSLADFERLARSLVEAGVHVLQLRDKQLDDRRLLQRARLLREWTRGTNTLFIVNDRADLAALSRADGVHLGQDDSTVKDARTIVGPEALIGVSTHSIEQARQAVLDGANYIGVGPTFPSGTKQFEHFPGLDLLRAVSAEIRLPAFAIGGITADNLPQILAARFTRIAVSGAITSATDAVAAAREMLGTLE